jgi:hypothetical protein
MGWPMYGAGHRFSESASPGLEGHDLRFETRSLYPVGDFWLSSAAGRSSMLDGLGECSSVTGTIKRLAYILPTD